MQAGVSASSRAIEKEKEDIARTTHVSTTTTTTTTCIESCEKISQESRHKGWRSDGCSCGCGSSRMFDVCVTMIERGRRIDNHSSRRSTGTSDIGCTTLRREEEEEEIRNEVVTVEQSSYEKPVALMASRPPSRRSTRARMPTTCTPAKRRESTARKLEPPVVITSSSSTTEKYQAERHFHQLAGSMIFLHFPYVKCR